MGINKASVFEATRDSVSTIVNNVEKNSEC